MKASLVVVSLFAFLSVVLSQCTPLTENFPSTFWMDGMTMNGISAFNNDPNNYQVFRNVKSFGAVGDGVTDDTAAINQAIKVIFQGSNSNRCGGGCDSTTIQPAIIYFPQGTYLVSSPIIQYYFSQLVGDAVKPPTIKASANFNGGNVIDSDPYYPNSGNNWYTNQNNFFRQVRNFVIDSTSVNGNQGLNLIHWQIAQATSVTNVKFMMPKNSNHVGMFADNGSGGWCADLFFSGGKYGMAVGNQQFTSTRLTFDGQSTAAISIIWDWSWVFIGINVTNVPVGLDMANGGSGSQQVGSISLLDAIFTNVDVAVKTSTTANSSPKASGTLVMENIVANNVNSVVKSPNGNVLLAGSSGSTTIQSWGQGQVYNPTKQNFKQGNLGVTRLNPLVDSNNAYVSRAKPQYESYDTASFINIKTAGARGDGVTDDTQVIQDVLNQNAGCKIIFFPMGSYVITSTITIPVGTRMVGQTWTQLMATGSYWGSMSSPKPVLKLGNPGDTGILEMSDFLFTTKGSVPGAILVEWNIADAAGQQATVGLWDCHFRIGGAAGTNLQTGQCSKDFGPKTDSCVGSFMLMHLASTSSAYMENIWAWTADHDLDGGNQVTLFNGRGILVESQGPVWLYGTASEHNVLYQYNLVNAPYVLMAMIQTETPYYQPNPPAPAPFVSLPAYNDPVFNCPANSASCAMAYGLRAAGNTNLYSYGGGNYNFFQNYNQACLQARTCQDTMVQLRVNAGSVINLLSHNTLASSIMVESHDAASIYQADNINVVLGSTVHLLYTSTVDPEPLYYPGFGYATTSSAITSTTSSTSSTVLPTTSSTTSDAPSTTSSSSSTAPLTAPSTSPSSSGSSTSSKMPSTTSSSRSSGTSSTTPSSTSSQRSTGTSSTAPSTASSTSIKASTTEASKISSGSSEQTRETSSTLVTYETVNGVPGDLEASSTKNSSQPVNKSLLAAVIALAVICAVLLLVIISMVVLYLRTKKMYDLSTISVPISSGNRPSQPGSPMASPLPPRPLSPQTSRPSSPPSNML